MKKRNCLWNNHFHTYSLYFIFLKLLCLLCCAYCVYRTVTIFYQAISISLSPEIFKQKISIISFSIFSKFFSNFFFFVTQFPSTFSAIFFFHCVNKKKLPERVHRTKIFIKFTIITITTIINSLIIYLFSVYSSWLFSHVIGVYMCVWLLTEKWFIISIALEIPTIPLSKIKKILEKRTL